MLLVLVFASEEERGAFDYLYTHYKGLMLQKANGILHDPMLAEDAVSEAFMLNDPPKMVYRSTKNHLILHLNHSPFSTKLPKLF